MRKDRGGQIRPPSYVFILCTLYNERINYWRLSFPKHLVLFLCVYGLFNDADSISDYKHWMARWLMDNELERIRSLLNLLLSWHLHGETERLWNPSLGIAGRRVQFRMPGLLKQGNQISRQIFPGNWGKEWTRDVRIMNDNGDSSSVCSHNSFFIITENVNWINEKNKRKRKWG